MNAPTPPPLTPHAPRRTVAIAVALALVGALAFGWPTLRGWQAERAASRAFDRDLERIELEIVDRKRTARGGYTEQTAENLRFERIHGLLHRHRYSAAPRFRKHINLMLGVYDRTAAQVAAANRAAKLTLAVQYAQASEVQDPERARRLIQLLAEMRHFATAFRGEVDASREYARQAVARSGLPLAQRAEIWRAADRAYLNLQPSVDGAERVLPVIKRLEVLVAFLDRHRGSYEVLPGDVIFFTDPDVQREWIVLERKTQRIER
jgi:hypothetical protein